jgi:hypothetical protein
MFLERLISSVYTVSSQIANHDPLLMWIIQIIDEEATIFWRI